MSSVQGGRSPAHTKPEEPSIDVMIGAVKERRPNGGLQRPVGGGAAGGLRHARGFPQADPKKHYGIGSSVVKKDAPVIGDNVDSLGSEAKRGATNVHFSVDDFSLNRLQPPRGGEEGGAGNDAANTTQLALVLATLHVNSFYANAPRYPLPSALLHAVHTCREQQAIALGGESLAEVSSLGPRTSNVDSVGVPVDVGGETFVALLERALMSSVAHHRMFAMDVILRELSNSSTMPRGATNVGSASPGGDFRDFFVFGPHCARRLHRLVICLAQAQPREGVRVLEVLEALVGQLLPITKQFAEILSEFAVPLGDAVTTPAASGLNAEPTFDQIRTDDDLRQLSEDIRFDLGRGLYLLGLHTVLQRVVIAPSDWAHVSGVPPPAARRVFWSLLSACVSYPPAALALCGGDAASGGLIDLIRREISSTMQPFLLGQEEICGDVTAPTTSVLIAVLNFLRRVCHVRQACYALVGTVRPILKLLFEHIQAALVASKPSTTDETLSAAAANPPGAMVCVLSFIVLRAFIRHGCDRVLGDFLPHLVALVGVGSLGAAELALLSSVDATDDDHSNILPSSIASALAQEAYNIVSPRAAAQHGSGRRHDDAGTQQVVLLRESTALQYLATYVGMEGLRAFAPWLAPTIPEAQQAIKDLLASSLLTSIELEQMFPATTASLFNSDDHDRAIVSSLRTTRSYNLTRFLMSVSRVFPATRKVVLGYGDAMIVKLVDVLYGQMSARGVAANCHSAGGIVFGTPLSIEELSTALEVLNARTSCGGEDDETKEGVQRSSTVAAPSRNTTAAALLLLDIMAHTLQCLDSVTLLAYLICPENSAAATTIQAALSGTTASNTAAGDAALVIDPATTSAGWMSKVLSVHFPTGVKLITAALTCHPRGKNVFRWELLFSDYLLWLCSHHQPQRPQHKPRSWIADAEDEGERLRCEGLLVLARVAFTARKITNAAVNQSVATSVGPYLASTFAVVSPQLPLSVVAGLCAAAALLPPEGSLACLRALQEARDTFSTTVECSKQPSQEIKTYLDVLFHQSFCAGGTLEQSSDDARQHVGWQDEEDNNDDPMLASWSSLQRMVECLQIVVPLFRFVQYGSWPHLLCGYLIRRLASPARALGDFVSICVQDTLQSLHWEGYDVEDARAASRRVALERRRTDDDVGHVDQHEGGGDDWDSDEFGFSDEAG